MANRVNVDLDLNVQGYVQGINKATQSTADYETEVRKIKDQQQNFRKEFSAAKREVQNLALAYSKLSKEAKESRFGKEMAAQLQEAKEKAANYVDMMGDIQTELKNMASDTKMLNIMSDSFGLIGDAASTTMGIIAQFTGNEEDARRAVVAFTTAQSALGVVTKLQNSLQKESNIMLGVAKIQAWAAAKATEAQASATVGATAAQKAFNLVANMNPYALLATSVIAVTAAVGAFVIATNKSKTAQEKLAEEMHGASVQGQKDAQAEIVKLDLLFNTINNTNLAMSDRLRAVKAIQQQYPGYFGDLSTEEILVGNASAAYRQLRDDILAVAKARAYEKKIQNLAEQNVDLEDEAEQWEAIVKQRERSYEQVQKGGAFAARAIQPMYESLDAARKKLQSINDQIKANQDAQQKYYNKIDVSAINRYEEGTTKPQTTHRSGGSKKIEQEKTELQKLEAEVKKYTDMLDNIDINAPDAPEIVKKVTEGLKKAQDELNRYKITVGLAPDPSELDKLEEEAKKKELLLRTDIPQEEKDKVYKDLKELRERIEMMKIQFHISINPDEIDTEAIRKQTEEINKIVEDALNPKEAKKFDFNFLPNDKQIRTVVDNTIKEYERLKDALEELNKIMNNPNASDTQIAEAQKAIEKLTPAFNAAFAEMNEWQDINDQINSADEAAQNLAATMNKVGNAAQTAGQLFSALGDATDEVSLKAVSIVAQAVATVALSYANALNSASKNWVTWLAFGVSGLATMAQMIGQIKSLTAGSYANGGVVGGHSYYGDKLIARVNSGETILTEKQAKKVNDQLDTNKINGVGQIQLGIVGQIRGTDILLVAKNANQVMKRAGNSINF